MKNSVFDVFGYSWAAIALGATGYFWVSYSGPFRWIAEAEIAVRDRYTPLFAGSMTAAFLVIAPIGIAFWALGKWGVLTDAQAPAPKPAAPSTSSKTNYAALYAVAVALFLGLGCVGGYQIFRASGSGPLREYDVASLAEQRPESRHVTLRGSLVPESAIFYESDTASGRHVVNYVPFVPPRWTPAAAVRFFVEYRSYAREPKLPEPGEARLSGLLHENDIPGPLRERSGLRLAEPFFVLNPGEVPSQTSELGWFLIGAGAFLGALIAGGAAWHGRRSRAS